MAWSDLFSGLLTFFILFAMFVLAYCAITKKSLTDFFNEIKEIIKSKKEDIIKK
jgi:hypothetical protein